MRPRFIFARGPRRRRRIVLTAFATVLLVAGGAALAFFTVLAPPEDVSDPSVEFEEPAATPAARPPGTRE
ncbi:MAG: hypothetical protein H0V03_06890, partial [Thermoleophilaceae bacterium]|nr:hypothetical protein [Thermoleophilaceae bacterium]